MNLHQIALSAASFSLLPITSFALSEPRRIVDADIVKVSGSLTGDMGIDGADGELAVSRFSLRSILSRPLNPIEGMRIIPFLTYTATNLDFKGTAAGFPIEDEGLHSISLNAVILQEFAESPWFGIGFTRAELATDFQDLSSDALTFDLTFGVGYRFSETLRVGLGVAALNLNGDADYYPGLFFAWLPTDEIRIGIYGPTLLASYQPHDSWIFDFRGEPGGGNWNFRDAAGASRTIELNSYRLGLFAKYRLANQFWLGAGVGIALGNQIDLRDNRGGNSFKRDLDETIFGEVSLSLYRW